MMLFQPERRDQHQASNVALPYRFRGSAGRFTYSFDDRYFRSSTSDTTVRRTAPKNRYGFFPSVGLGWVISNEPFFKGATEVVQYLKLRGTWGRVGNSQISGRRFAYLATVKDNNDTSYQFGKNMDQTYGTTAIDEYAVDVTWGDRRQDQPRTGHAPAEQQVQPAIHAFKESRRASTCAVRASRPISA